ncbi:hypothetical protein LOZ12_001108 [Ophidiomyces ophidiicola]|uniref:Uncharacterized protein n=1 Tax=Ophidiomyces ophidiicola TaxID=1387563 RepID=A0ACB8V273_9EURO|nr:hypothetical protein LOZ64_001715 [Ophidiomyces ophidiicola]KAI1954457.1 hypothetical protein LOZ62_000751 [Ophidiomyces ophidiicola]KAI1961853.1 hypothetical protein LOZ59_002292 [Ophidiomyces ophidiicola]KAI1974443.1 hypothetical protein LOZ56_001186 [Ophidiomyces ophidiicola]KAI2008947.1 hypothetical protein LOZ50_001866 [Ophidiomyces ophidiicola]
MFGVADNSVFEEFEREELRNPSARKEIDGRLIYISRKINTPEKYIGAPVLCDFGSAVFDDEKKNTKLVQPNMYRAPEVILRSPWNCKIDIWNAGCMLWDIFKGRNLFSNPEHKTYDSQTHLASIIGLLGPPPLGLLKRGTVSAEFFTAEGKFKGGIELPPASSLDQIEARYQGQDQDLFLKFVRKMIQWAPDNRSTANELLHDAWLNSKL